MKDRQSRVAWLGGILLLLFAWLLIVAVGYWWVFRSPLRLQWAIDSGDSGTVKRMIGGGADANARLWWNGNYPIYEAARLGHADIAGILLDAGVDIEARGDLGTPLHVAALAGRPEMVRLLVSRGADVNAKHLGGFTPLHFAAMASSPGDHAAVSIARCLLSNGADVNAASESGDTPIQRAAFSGSTELVKLLIDSGADVNAGSETFFITPLGAAASEGYKETVGCLLDRGADINAADCFGRTPLDFSSPDEIKRLLRAHGALPGSELRKGP